MLENSAFTNCWQLISGFWSPLNSYQAQNRLPGTCLWWTRICSMPALMSSIWSSLAGRDDSMTSRRKPNRRGRKTLLMFALTVMPHPTTQDTCPFYRTACMLIIEKASRIRIDHFELAAFDNVTSKQNGTNRSCPVIALAWVQICQGFRYYGPLGIMHWWLQWPRKNYFCGVDVRKCENR